MARMAGRRQPARQAPDLPSRLADAGVRATPQRLLCSRRSRRSPTTRPRRRSTPACARARTASALRPSTARWPSSSAAASSTSSHIERESCYRLCQPGHHHHMVCERCHRVEELEGCGADDWIAHASRRHGFQVASHTGGRPLRGLPRGLADRRPLAGPAAASGSAPPAPEVLERRGQRQALAQMLQRLVRRESRPDRRQLEEDAARLAEVDGAEVEAVDDGSGRRPGGERLARATPRAPRAATTTQRGGPSPRHRHRVRRSGRRRRTNRAPHRVARGPSPVGLKPRPSSRNSRLADGSRL